MAAGDLLAQTNHGTFNMSAKFVNKERYIGVDQGRCNFPIIAVDKDVDHPPMVVVAAKYIMALCVQFSTSDVLLKLQEVADLWPFDAADRWWAIARGGLSKHSYSTDVSEK